MRESKVSGRYIIIPLLYVLVIAGLIYAQFGRSSNIDLMIGNIEFSAQFPPGSGSATSTPSKVSVVFGSMSFISDTGRLIVEDDNGSRRPVRLLDYLSDSRRVALDYEADIHLTVINTSPNRGAMEIRAMDSSVTSVSFQVSDVLKQPDERVPVFLEDGTAAIFPVGTYLDAKNRTLWIPMNSPAHSAILYRVNPELVEEPFLFWLEESYSFARREEVDALRASILDVVYNGWTSSRYSESTSSWKLADGSVGFDEAAFGLLIGESLERGSFRELYTRILSISRVQAKELSYRTAPLLGNIVRTAETIAEDDAMRIGLIRQLLESSDPAVFKVQDLVPFVFDRAPYSIARELINLATLITPDNVSASEAVGLVEFLVDAGSYDDDLDIGKTAILDRFRGLILPFMKAGVFGLYLVDENSMADIEATILAGFILDEIGTGDTLLDGIAIELQKYGLSIADSQGFIPKFTDPQRPTEDQGVGNIAPEIIFKKLTQNSYIPREISLFDTDGPGIWIWTAAQNFEVESTSETYALSFDFEVGYAHHLIFRGIERFSSITLFGIPWKNDPLFQNYTSGWTYIEEDKTLYMKLTHRSTREQVVIRK